MKKCPGCSREIDKYGIACQYCGRVEAERAKERQKEKDGKQKKDYPNRWKK